MKPAKTQAQTSPRLVDLTALSQSEVSRLIGRPTSYVRDRSDLFERDAKGRYDARQVVAALMANESEEVSAEPIDIEECDQHVMHLAFGGYLGDLPYLRPLARILERLVGEHGDAALAELGKVTYAAICREIEYDEETVTSGSGPNDREILELKAQEWIEEQLSKARDDKYRRAGRVVPKCKHCGRWEWIGEWRKGEPPAGYLAVEDPCDECMAKGLY